MVINCSVLQDLYLSSLRCYIGYAINSVTIVIFVFFIHFIIIEKGKIEILHNDIWLSPDLRPSAHALWFRSNQLSLSAKYFIMNGCAKELMPHLFIITSNGTFNEELVLNAHTFSCWHSCWKFIAYLTRPQRIADDNHEWTGADFSYLNARHGAQFGPSKFADFIAVVQTFFDLADKIRQFHAIMSVILQEPIPRLFDELFAS